jgi:hypothetical protein
MKANYKNNIVIKITAQITVCVLTLFIVLFGSGLNIEIGNYKVIYILSLWAFILSIPLYLIDEIARRSLIIIFPYITILLFIILITTIKLGENANFSDIPALLIPLWLSIFIIAFKDQAFLKFFDKGFLVLIKLILFMHLIFLFMLNNGIEIYQLEILLILKGELVDNENYFYINSFIYYLVGFWINIESKNKNKHFYSFLFIVAIILTGQRGLMATLFLVYFYYILQNKISIINILNFILLIIIMSTLIIYFYQNMVNRDIATSDYIRYETLKEVYELMSWHTIFIGNGIGIGIPIRPIHMENFWLEIMHKQGLIGIFCQILILLPLIKKMINSNYANSEILKYWNFGLLSIIVLSITNPYYGNYYGYIIFLIYTSLYFVSENEARIRNSYI